MSIYEYGGPPAPRRGADDVPDQCEYVTEVKVSSGREHTFICGGLPEYRCHNKHCGQGHICAEHVAVCEECEREFHNDSGCLPIARDKRRVCLSCSLTIEECALFGESISEVAAPSKPASPAAPARVKEAA